MVKEENKFKKALEELPVGVSYDPFRHHTIEDLTFSVLTELDLINEGQVSALDKEVKSDLEDWLEKWGRED